MRLFLLTAFCLLFSIGATAQQKERKYDYVYRMDSRTGKVVSEHVKYVKSNDNYNCQYTVSYVDTTGVLHEGLTTDSICGYYHSRNTYTLKSFVFRGERVRAFLNREEAEGMVFYTYTGLDTKKYTYVQLDANRDEIVPIEDYWSDGYVSPVRTKLLADPLAQNDYVANYINNKKMTVDSYTNISRLLKVNKTNSFSRFRWGVQGSVGFQSVSHDEHTFSYDNAFKASGGLFADIPVFSTISFHPEVAFSKYHTTGSISNTPKSWAVNNVTMIQVPLLVRFSYPYLRGKLTPFVDLGYMPCFKLKDKFEEEVVTGVELEGEYSWKYEYYTSPGPFVKLDKYESDGEKFEGKLVFGLGVEWQIMKSHSLFFEVRGAVQPSTNVVPAMALNVAFNI